MKKIDKKNIFIVISAYNESGKIEKILDKLQDYLGKIVIVDDGSTDNTSKVLSKFSRRPNFIILTHQINLGKGAAMKTGAEYSFNNGAKAVIFMDADGQHLPSDLPKFLGKLDGGYDIVFGSRNMAYGVPIVRFLGNKTGSVLVNILFGIFVSDLGCGFRALSQKAYKKVEWESEGYGVETEMIVRTAKNKLEYCEVPIQTVYLDKYKGMTIIDALGIFIEVIRLKLTL